MPARIPFPRTLPRLASGAAVLALGLAGLTACGGSELRLELEQRVLIEQRPRVLVEQRLRVVVLRRIHGGRGDHRDREGLQHRAGRGLLKAGSYTITVMNTGSATHDLAVEEDGTTKAKSDKIGPGQSTTLTVDLDAGEYVFFCSIGNHRAMGMELKVQVS